MVMGDLVLTEDEVTPVLTKLQEGGVEQTALHNHVLHESPRVMYMHISAMDDGVKTAKAIRPIQQRADRCGGQVGKNLLIALLQLAETLG